MSGKIPHCLCKCNGLLTSNISCISAPNIDNHDDSTKACQLKHIKKKLDSSEKKPRKRGRPPKKKKKVECISNISETIPSTWTSSMQEDLIIMRNVLLQADPNVDTSSEMFSRQLVSLFKDKHPNCMESERSLLSKLNESSHNNHTIIKEPSSQVGTPPPVIRNPAVDNMSDIEGFTDWNLGMIRDLISCLDRARRKHTDMKESDPNMELVSLLLVEWKMIYPETAETVRTLVVRIRYLKTNKESIRAKLGEHDLLPPAKNIENEQRQILTPSKSFSSDSKHPEQKNVITDQDPELFHHHISGGFQKYDAYISAQAQLFRGHPQQQFQGQPQQSRVIKDKEDISKEAEHIEEHPFQPSNHPTPAQMAERRHEALNKLSQSYQPEGINKKFLKALPEHLNQFVMKTQRELIFGRKYVAYFPIKTTPPSEIDEFNEALSQLNIEPIKPRKQLPKEGRKKKEPIKKA